MRSGRIYGVIGLYALGLRIGQYGWTSERVFAVTICTMLTIAAFAYAIGVLRPRGPWLAALPRINVALSLLAIATIAALNSPLLDPHRIGAGDQLRRWRDGRTDADHLDTRYLRYDSGRRGYRALQALQSDPRVAADAALADSIRRLLDRQTVPGWSGEAERRRTRVIDAEVLAARIHPAQGSAPPEPALLRALLGTPGAVEDCLFADADCIAIDRDFDGDGRNDVLLCDLGTESVATCALWTRSAEGDWRQAATLNWYISGDSQRAARALREGKVEIRPRRWPDLSVDGQIVVPAVIAEPPPVETSSAE
jgi:hypothetical protein